MRIFLYGFVRRSPARLGRYRIAAEKFGTVRVALNVNPHSRRGPSACDEAIAALEAAGVEIVQTQGHTSARQCDALVAVGGDGTLLHAIGDALRLNLPLGIVPTGTFNELARTLEIPLDIAEACRVVAAGNARAIDIGMVNGVHYVNEASIGISSRAARMQTSEIKRRFGFLGVLATTIQAVRFSRPMLTEITFDSHTVVTKTVQLTVANSNRFGGIFAVSDAAIDDGWLDLYSLEISGFKDVFSVAAAMRRGKRVDVPGLRTFRAKEFSVRQPRSHHIMADGEPAGKTPATFSLLPKALRVFVPQ